MSWDSFNKSRPWYYVWKTMMTNCGHMGNPNPRQIKFYVSRGISVCEEWRNKYRFAEWLISNGWKPRMRLCVARIDKAMGFSPENCIVISHADAQNIRSNLVRIGGRSIRDVVGCGVYEERRRRRNAHNRISMYGWSADDALTVPTIPRSEISKSTYGKKSSQ